MSTKSTCINKGAVLLSLLSVVHAQRAGDQGEFEQMTQRQQRDALTDVPADQLKSMLLNMLEDEKTQKVPRPRKPDMRSPLEAQKDKNAGKSKYHEAFEQRLKNKPNNFDQPVHTFDAFREQSALDQLSPIERSLEENRRQREYLLREYRQDSALAQDDDQYEEQYPPMSKKDRKHRKKESKRQRKAQEMYGMPYGHPYGQQPYDDREYAPVYPQQLPQYPRRDVDADFDADFWSEDDRLDDQQRRTLRQPDHFEERRVDPAVIEKGENFDVVNDGPDTPRDKWVQDPIQMGDQSVNPGLHSWEDFEKRYEQTGQPLTKAEETKMELDEAKQEYFEQLKRHADFEKKHPLEENAETKPKHIREPDPEEWKDLTPAQRQKKENARHFQELQDLKKAAEGDDYKLPVPIKPERQEYKPSDGTDPHPEMTNQKEHIDLSPEKAPEKEDMPAEHPLDGPTTDLPSGKDHPEVKKEEPPTESQQNKNQLENQLFSDDDDETAHGGDNHENKLQPEADEKDDGMNPYERALRDNENHKKSFMDELKRETEERKKQAKEEKEAKEQAERDHRVWLEDLWRETGEIPQELQELMDAEEKQRQEEEAKRRPEPPNAKTMRERVAEESKRRKDAHMEKLRLQGEEEKRQKQEARDAETKRRRLEDPTYMPPPPLTVPKGKPAPPKDYKYPKKAREHGFGPPIDEDEEKKKKEKEQEEKELKELEAAHEEKKPEHHLPKPETQRPQPETKKPKKDKKKKKKRQAKKPSRKDEKDKDTKAKPDDTIHKLNDEDDQPDQDQEKKSSKKPKKSKEPEPEHQHLKPRAPTPQKKKSKGDKPSKKSTKPKKQSKPEKESHPAKPQHEKEKEPLEQEVEFSEPDSHDRYQHHHEHSRDPHDLEDFEDMISHDEDISARSEKLSWPDHSDRSYIDRHQQHHYEHEHRHHDQESEHQIEPVPIFHHHSEHPQHEHPQHEHPQHEHPQHDHHYDHRSDEHHHGHLKPVVSDDFEQSAKPEESPAHQWHFKRGGSDDHTPHHVQKEVYEHEFLQLDKKTGQEHGRLAEHEQSSDSSFGAYQRQMADEMEHHRPRHEERHLYSVSDKYDDYERSHRRYRSRSGRARSYDDHYYSKQPSSREHELRGHDDRYHPQKRHSRQRSYDDRELHRYSLDRETEQLATLPWHKSDRSKSFERKQDHHERHYGKESKYHERPHEDKRHLEPQTHHKDRTYRDEWSDYKEKDRRHGHKEQNPRDHYKPSPSYEREPRRHLYDDDYYQYESRHGQYSRDKRHYSEKPHTPELDLFKQPREYLDEHERHPQKDDDKHRRHYRGETERSHRQKTRRHDDYMERPRHYYDHEDDHHDAAYNRRHQRRHSADEKRFLSDEPKYPREHHDDHEFSHEDRKARAPRRKHNKKQLNPGVQPAKPKAEQAPQQPAQQFVIPSTHPKSEDEDTESEDSEAIFEKRQQKKKVPSKPTVPVMRRHGEPLMIMPEWKKQPQAEKSDRELWIDELEKQRGHREAGADRGLHSDSEREFFETEATTHPFRIYPEHAQDEEEKHFTRDSRPYHHDWKPHLNLAHTDQEQDDLAHAVIATFSEVMMPRPRVQYPTAYDISLNLESQDDAQNKLQMPIFNVFKDKKGNLKAKPVVDNRESSSSSSSSESERTQRKKQTKKDSDSSSSSNDSSDDKDKQQSSESSQSDSSESSSSDKDTERDQESWVSDVSRANQESNSENNEDTSNEDEDDFEEKSESYNSEEIEDAFDKAMQMLRHHSHGFNLEAVQFPSLKEFSERAKQAHPTQDFTKPYLHLSTEPVRTSDLDGPLAPIYEHPSEYHERPHNNLMPNFPVPDENSKKKKGPKGGLPQQPKSPAMKEEMDYLAHQRLLKDRSMRRKKQKQQPIVPQAPKIPPMTHRPPVLPVPQKDQVDPITKEPLLEGEQFDMMAYMKKQRLAKEKQMLEKEREDPKYKPLSPTAHKPAAIPRKDQKKLHDAERKQRRQMERETPAPRDDKSLKDKTLFDQINHERQLRERKMREADPSYEPLSPTAKQPLKKKTPAGGKRQPEEKEDTLFEQMQKLRSDHERKLIEEDAKRAAADPTYTPKFKTMPQPEVSDPSSNLKKRLEEERRKHREDYEEQFEDELYEEDSEDYDSEYDDELTSDYDTNLDYYYDADGFAHPKRSKEKFGYDRYKDAYNMHYDPHKNISYSDESLDSSDGSSYSSYSDEYSDHQNAGRYSHRDRRGHNYDPHGRFGEPSFKRSNDKFDQSKRNKRSTNQRYQQNGAPVGTNWGNLGDSVANDYSLASASQEESTGLRNSQLARFSILNLLETDTPISDAMIIDSLPTTIDTDTPTQPEDEEGQIDELLKEVQKELHTRFKNMFEGEMLLPNLANNPEFEASNKANLLSLEDGEIGGEQDGEQDGEDSDHDVAHMSHDHLLSLAQSANWLHGRSMWKPKSQQTYRETGYDSYSNGHSYNEMGYDNYDNSHNYYLQ